MVVTTPRGWYSVSVVKVVDSVCGGGGAGRGLKDLCNVGGLFFTWRRGFHMYSYGADIGFLYFRLFIL